MKLLLVPASTCADPTYGRVLSSLAMQLRELGHEARILSLRPGKMPALELKPPVSIPIHWCSAAARVRQTAAVMRDFRPDFVHLHFSGSPTPWLGELPQSAKQAGARLAVTFQDYRHPDLAPYRREHKKLLRRIMIEADRISAVSAFLKKRISGDFPEFGKKIRVVPNGAPLFKTADKNGPASGKKTFILSAGRLAHYKGMDLLLMAFALARQSGLRSQLIICGADFQNGRLQKFAARLGLGPSVRFAGLLQRSETEKLMRGCLFFALFSRFESFGMAALEAMACGKAALLSGTGGMREFALHGRNALLIRPQDCAGAAQLMLRLERDGNLRRRLEAAALKTSARLAWPEVAKKYVSFYRG